MVNKKVMDFVDRALPREEVAGMRILEVGSYNVNGTPRQVIQHKGPSEYLGVDISQGPCVDRVVDVLRLVEEVGAESFDVIVSTEMLEHVEDWRGSVTQMKRVLRTGGVLVLTTRSPGFPWHGYPIDCWRYTKDDMRRIFADMELAMIEDDPEPGVLVKAVKRAPYRELDLGPIEVLRMVK